MPPKTSINDKDIQEIKDLLRKTEEKQGILEEILLRIQTESVQRHTILEEKIKNIDEKLDFITNTTQRTTPEEEPTSNTNIQTTDTNTDEHIQKLIQYFEENYSHLRKISNIYIQEEAFKAKKNLLPMWKNLLNQRKLAFYNTIKNKEFINAYKNFLTQENIFIPKKFREKITPQDTDTQIQIKNELSRTKLESQTRILEDRMINYQGKYLEIDEKISTEIKNLCPEETHSFLMDLWQEECTKEENFSNRIVEKQKNWLLNLQEQELKEEEERKNQTSHNTRKKHHSQHRRTPHNRSNKPNIPTTNYHQVTPHHNTHSQTTNTYRQSTTTTNGPMTYSTTPNNYRQSKCNSPNNTNLNTMPQFNTNQPIHQMQHTNYSTPSYQHQPHLNNNNHSYNHNSHTTPQYHTNQPFPQMYNGNYTTSELGLSSNNIRKKPLLPNPTNNTNPYNPNETNNQFFLDNRSRYKPRV